MGKGSSGKKSNPNKEPLGQRHGRNGGSSHHSRSDYGDKRSFHGHGQRYRGGYDHGRRRDWGSSGWGHQYYCGFGTRSSIRGRCWQGWFGSSEANYFRDQIQNLLEPVETEEEKEARINVEKKQREEKQQRKEERKKTKKVRKIADDLRRKLNERKSDGLESNIFDGVDDEEEEKPEEPENERALDDLWPTNEDFRSIGRLPEAAPHLEDNPEGGDLQEEGLVSAADYVNEETSYRESSTQAMGQDMDLRSSERGGPENGEQQSSMPKRLKRKSNVEGNQEGSDGGKKRKLEDATQRIVQQLKPIIKTKDNNWLRRVIDSKTTKSVKSLLMSTLVKEHRSHLTSQLNSVRFRHTADEMLPASSSESLDFDSEDSLFSFQEIDVNDLPESLISQIEDMIKRERPDVQEDANRADYEEDDEIQEVPVPPKPPAPLVNLESDSEEEVELPPVRQHEGQRDMPETRPENRRDLSGDDDACSFRRYSGNLRNNCDGEIEASSSIEAMKQKFKLLNELDRKESLWQERMENLRREMLTINDTLADIRRERSNIIGDALSYRRN